MAVRVHRSRPDPDILFALGPRWDALADLAGASFFQRWTWLGALATERFPDPVLIEATEDGQTLGLAIGNRVGWPPVLHLASTGDVVWDSVFIEHNGPVVMPGRPDVMRAMLAAMRPVLLPGVGDAVMAAVHSLGGRAIQTRPAPYRDLHDAGAVSRNTRQALARSARAYGQVTLTAAATPAEAREWFAEMVALHTATWNARGKPGAFTEPSILRLHHALIDRGVSAGTVDMLRVSSGEGLIGVLYTFIQGGTAYAYQSGFDYAGAHGAQKPGLSSHAAAIAHYAARGMNRYDFLAGESQYKRSLSSGVEALHWARLRPAWDPRAWRPSRQRDVSG